MPKLADLEADFTAAVLAPDAPIAGRAAIYRTLVRANLRDVFRGFLPRTIARRGDAFARDVDAFLAERGPRTHYLRDAPFELIDFLAPRWRVDADVPPYLIDLARHELVAMEVGAADDPRTDGLGELGLDDRAIFTASARLRRYAHAVHELPDDEADRTVPTARPAALLAYRDAEHDVRYLELSPAAAAIVEALLAGSTLRDAITRGAAIASVPIDDALLASLGTVLADLAARDVLLGGSPVGDPPPPP